MKRLVKAATSPFGKSTVGKSRPSTGIYGRKVGGAKTRSDAVRARGRR